jgi:homoserine kinase
MASLCSATAFAPATVANVAVGFDVLGFALAGPGDRVSVTRRTGPPGRSVTIEGIGGVARDLPRDPARNTAAAAVRAMVEALGLGGSFTVSIEKGIPLSAGMGGSAASAVGAVVAANALLETPVGREELLRYALEGEAAGCGSRHADNAAPCLYGGLVAVVSAEPPDVVSIPVPQGVLCVLVRPRLEVRTREARSVLLRHIALQDHVRQSARLAGFVAGCCRGDLDLVRRSMADLVIEPQRSSLIPGFDEAKRRALDRGALGFSISGSGPSVFAWVCSREAGESVAAAVIDVFRDRGLDADYWISAVGAPGAAVEDREGGGRCGS